MKRLMALAVALLMLSCSCQNEVRESRPPMGGIPMVASVTRCFSGSDSVKVFLKVERIIDGDTFEGHVIQNGIDAPERGQFYGDVATLHLQWLISGKAVGLKLKKKICTGDG